MEPSRTKTILYVRLPGLLAAAARKQRAQTNITHPLVVAEGRLVRDACLSALEQGVKIGLPVSQARRLCPFLLAVPLEEVDAVTLSYHFLDLLADLSPVLELSGPDAAYVDLTGANVQEENIRALLQEKLGLFPVLGFGASRLAARAVTESNVDCLAFASVTYLWPDDPAVVGQLQRLGLTTFGAVAAVSEESLRLYFGKIAPVLHRRAQGVDLTPVRALYPPPFVDVVIDCGEAPVDNLERLMQVIAKASQRTQYQLQGLGAGRLLTLEIKTERETRRQAWAVPVPLQHAVDIQRAAVRLLSQTRLTAPVLRVRLLIENISLPEAHTADLFGVRADSMALEAVRRRLAARFGLTTLKILGQQPRTAREKRRAAVQESWGNRESWGMRT